MIAHVRRIRLAPLLGGLALLFVYARMHDEMRYLWSTWASAEAFSNAQLNGWVSSLVLLVPGNMLVAYGVMDLISPGLKRMWRAATICSASTFHVAAATYGLLLLALALLGQSFVLRDLAVTDSEHQLRLGGQILATGATSLAAPPHAEAFYFPLQYLTGGRLVANDYPVPLAVSALGALADPQSPSKFPFALLAAGSAVALLYSAKRLWGVEGAMIAGLVWLASPMGLLGSMVALPEIVARSFVAFALLPYANLQKREHGPRNIDIAAFVFLSGMSVMSQLPECALLLAPLHIHVMWRLAHDRRAALVYLGCALAALPLTAWCNIQTTGNWLQVLGTQTVVRLSVWDLLGAEVAAQVLLLTIWFCGPLAVLLLTGAERTGVTRALLLGVFGALLAGVASPNEVMFPIGPARVALLAAPLTLLATGALLRVFKLVCKHELAPNAAVALVAGYLVAIGLLDLNHARVLHHQAQNQQDLLDATKDLHNAIILAQPPRVFFEWAKNRRNTGSWVHEFPSPAPTLGDVVYARETANYKELSLAYPTRSIYGLIYRPNETPEFKVTKLAGP